MTKRRIPKPTQPSVATGLEHTGTLVAAYARNGTGWLEFDDELIILVSPTTGVIPPAALIGVQRLARAIAAGERPQLRVEYAEVTGRPATQFANVTKRYASKIEVLP